MIPSALALALVLTITVGSRPKFAYLSNFNNLGRKQILIPSLFKFEVKGSSLSWVPVNIANSENSDFVLRERSNNENLFEKGSLRFVRDRMRLFKTSNNLVKVVSEKNEQPVESFTSKSKDLKDRKIRVCRHYKSQRSTTKRKKGFCRHKCPQIFRMCPTKHNCHLTEKIPTTTKKHKMKNTKASKQPKTKPTKIKHTKATAKMIDPAIQPEGLDSGQIEVNTLTYSTAPTQCICFFNPTTEPSRTSMPFIGDSTGQTLTPEQCKTAEPLDPFVDELPPTTTAKPKLSEEDKKEEFSNEKVFSLPEDVCYDDQSDDVNNTTITKTALLNDKNEYPFKVKYINPSLVPSSLIKYFNIYSKERANNRYPVLNNGFPMLSQSEKKLLIRLPLAFGKIPVIILKDPSALKISFAIIDTPRSTGPILQTNNLNQPLDKYKSLPNPLIEPSIYGILPMNPSPPLYKSYFSKTKSTLF